MARSIDVLDSMPPWDAAAYFQAISERTVAVAGPNVPLCTADPNRVGLIIAYSQSSGLGTPGSISTQASAGVNAGIVVSSSLPPVVLLFSETGPLCQMAWYGSVGSGSTFITVYEIALSKWPRKRVPSNGQRKIAVNRQRDRSGYPNRPG